MKTSEFKLRIVTGLNDLIDQYFGSKSISDKLINSTLKIIVQQNQNKYDNMLELFADETGDVDTDLIINKYIDAIGDGVILDLRDYVHNQTVKNLLPNKALRITKDDIMMMFI